MPLQYTHARDVYNLRTQDTHKIYARKTRIQHTHARHAYNFHTHARHAYNTRTQETYIIYARKACIQHTHARHTYSIRTQGMHTTHARKTRIQFSHARKTCIQHNIRHIELQLCLSKCLCKARPIDTNNTYKGSAARTVYMHHTSGHFPAKNTSFTVYIYGSGQPYAYGSN